jgi:hypothetical protein
MFLDRVILKTIGLFYDVFGPYFFLFFRLKKNVLQ